MKTYYLLFIILCFKGNFYFAQASSLRLTNEVNYAISQNEIDVSGNQITVECLAAYEGINQRELVSKHTGPANVNYLLRFGWAELTTVGSGFSQMGVLDATQNVQFVQGKVYHLAFTYDGSFFRYYVNGCMTYEEPMNGNMVQNNLPTRIGNTENGSVANQSGFTGYIDEVRIWNVARTEEQLRENMRNLPNPTTQVGLLAYYKFDGANPELNNQGNAAYNLNFVGPGVTFEQMPDPLPFGNVHLNVDYSISTCHQPSLSDINVSASGGYAPYEFSAEGTNWFPETEFQRPPGNWNIFARSRGSASCVTQQTILIPSVAPIGFSLTQEDVSCFGEDDGQASVSPSGGGPYTINSGNNPDYKVRWLPIDEEGTTVENLAPGDYTVEITDSCKSAGFNLVTNGDFEQGNTGFTTDYTFNGISYVDFQANRYAVANDPSIYNGGFFTQGLGGGGKFMILDGHTTAGASIWCQTITVEPDSYYNFSAFFTNIFTGNPVNSPQIYVEINGVQVGDVLNVSEAVNDWQELTLSWFSEGNTTADICIKNLETLSWGNDFGVDGISFKACNSCTATRQFTIVEPSDIILTPIIIQPTCSGGDGSITINATGGDGTYEYSIDDGVTFQASNVFSDLGEGTYDIVVKDGDDCEKSEQVTLTQPNNFTTTITAENITCFGEDNGSILIELTGGTPDYTYSIDNGTTVFTSTDLTYFFDDLSSGSYLVRVTDDNNCVFTETVNLTEPNEIIIDEINVENVSCFGLSNGTISVQMVGGNVGFEFSIDNGVTYQVSNEFTGLTPNDYTLTVKNAVDCVVSDVVSISSPTDIIMTPAIVQPTCSGGDGSITINATGGDGTYEYSIDDGVTFQASNVFSDLGEGTYDIVVKDGDDCEKTEQVTLTQPNNFTTTITVENITCFGEDNGSILIELTGGTPDYTYSIDNGTTVFTSTDLTYFFDDLSSGSYLVRVTDDNNCEFTEVVTVDTPNELLISEIETSDLTCFESLDGLITITHNGGQGAVEFSSDGGTTFSPSSNFNSLPAGTYDIVVRDENNCTASQQVTLEQPTALTISLDSQDVSCFGAEDGSISVVGGGGTLGYVYSIDGGVSFQTEAVFNGLSSGSYTIILKDANDCEVSDQVDVSSPESLVIETTIDPILCNGGTGGIEVTASGGTPTYMYDLSGVGAQTSNVFSNLLPNTYTLIVSDNNQCLYQEEITLTEPSPIELSVTESDSICIGEEATLTINATGGTAPYTYNWNQNLPNQSQHTVSVNQTTTYQAQVDDANGCSVLSDEIVMSTYAPVDINIVSSAPAVCSGEEITLEAEVVSGKEDFTFSWSNNINPSWSSTSQSFNYLMEVPTTFSVTVTDFCNQTVTKTHSIGIHPDPNVQFSTTNDKGCAPFETTFFSTMSASNQQNQSCFWIFSDGTSISSCDEVSHVFQNPGDYDVTFQVTNNFGCFSEATYVDFISVSPPPVADFEMSTSVIELTSTNVEFTNNSDNAITFDWDFGDGSVGSDSKNTSHSYSSDDLNRTYEVSLTVFDQHNCSDQTSRLITVKDHLIFYIPNTFTPNGDGSNEVFKAQFTSGYDPFRFKMLIFNRWGEVVFESLNASKGWDGTYGGSKPVPEGTYIWTIEYFDTVLNDIKTISGHVNVLR